MLLQLEQECLEVYRRKVDNASHARARLHQTIASAESEFAALFSALGEPTLSQRVSGLPSLQKIETKLVEIDVKVLCDCSWWLSVFIVVMFVS
jgi:hypothetical protein